MIRQRGATRQRAPAQFHWALYLRGAYYAKAKSFSIKPQSNQPSLPVSPGRPGKQKVIFAKRGWTLLLQWRRRLAITNHKENT